MEYHILISDDVHPVCQEIFQSEPDFEVDHRPGLESSALRAIIGQYVGLIARSGTQITADIIDAADKLRVIGGWVSGLTIWMCGRRRKEAFWL